MLASAGLISLFYSFSFLFRQKLADISIVKKVDRCFISISLGSLHDLLIQFFTVRSFSERSSFKCSPQIADYSNWGKDFDKACAQIKMRLCKLESRRELTNKVHLLWSAVEIWKSNEKIWKQFSISNDLEIFKISINFDILFDFEYLMLKINNQQLNVTADETEEL